MSTRRSQRGSRRSEDRRYEGLLDGLLRYSPDAVTLTERLSRRFLEVSESFCALSGYSREELIGRTAVEVGLIGEDAQRVLASAHANGSHGDPDELEILCRDGSLRLVDISLAPLEGSEVVLTIIRDLAERRALEAQLRLREQRFTTAIGTLLDPFVMLSPVRDDHGEIVDFRFDYANDAYCSVARFDQDRLLGRTVGELFPAFPGSERFALCCQVAISGEPATSETLVGADAWAGSPLAGRAFDTVIAAMGEGIVLSGREVTARRRAEQARAWAEAGFRDVIESAPDAMVIVDAAGEIVLVNAQTEKLFGYTRDELIGRSHAMLVPERLRERHQGHRAGYMADLRARPMGARIEMFARRKDGGEVPVDISLSPLRAESGTLVCSAIRDMTESRRARHELALRAELLDLAHDAVIVRDTAENRVILWNREAEAVYGYSAAEAIGQVTHELLGTVFPDGREAVDEALARDGRWSGELRHIRKDGSEILVSSRQALQRDTAGRGIAIIALNSDITAQRRAEAELRASRRRLSEAERIAGMGSFERNISDNSVTLSDGLLAIFGLSADQFDGTFDAVLERFEPDDRVHVQQTLGQAIAERSSYSVDYRAIRTDGRIRHLRSHGDIVVDDHGQPIRVVGVVQDISDAKLARETLQSTSAELGRRANELERLALRTASTPPDTPHAPLTPRQLEILRLVAQGLTNAAIAERLTLTESTIKSHIHQILAKTNSKNRAEAIAIVLGTSD